MRMPRWWGRVNRTVFNPRELARGERPVLTHVGRVTGTVHRTPLDAYPVDGGYLFTLVYGSGSDWVRNVLAAGHAELSVDGTTVRLTAPRLVGLDEADQALGTPGRRRWLRVQEHLRMDTGAAAIRSSDVT